MERCRVRFAVAADDYAIARVHVSARQQGYTGLLPEEYLATLTIEDSQAHWSDELSGIRGPEQSVRYLVAEFVDRESDRRGVVRPADGDIVGFIGFGSPRDPDVPAGFGELQSIYVSPQYWGRGVSTLLLTRAEAELHAAGFSSAYTWVLIDSRRARRFLRRHGWRETGLFRADGRYPGSPKEIQCRRVLA